MRSHTRPSATSSPSSYSKNSNTRQDHPHLSGAYIRSMVKQLSSSSSTARSKGQNFNTAMGRSTPHNQQQPQQDDQEHKQQDQQQEQAPTTPLVALQPVQVKKQVRRRLHTSRPYQERLLNMAEARREIVTALKIHRATMRQSKDQQEQQLLQLQRQQQQQLVQVPLQEQSQAVGATATITPMSTISYDAFFSNHLLNSPLALANLMAGTSYLSLPSTLPYLTPVALVPPNAGLDYLACGGGCSRPAQPLGLNLSFQGFNGFVYDGENSNNSFDRPLIQPSPASSCSAYSSPSAAMASHGSPAVYTAENNAPSPAPLHPVLEDEEMTAIFSIGERRSDEWSDTVEVSTPAWWSKLLLDQSTEDGGGGLGAAAGQEGGTVGVTGNVVGMPAGRLCDGLGEQVMITGGSKPDGVLEMHLGDYYYRRQGDSDGEDITLPCMEIGEIEGWDGEWFP